MHVDLSQFDNQAYSGYQHRQRAAADDELARVGPDTPAGEYLRRYWHPVVLSHEIDERPKLIRRFGEDLVAFRDSSGRVGLVHKHCPHRRASLEYGTCDADGVVLRYLRFRFMIASRCQLWAELGGRRHIR